MIPFPPCDTNASASGSHEHKSCCTSFWISWPKECDAATNDTFSIMWCWHWCQRCHMIKPSCCISFQLSLSKECNGAIDDAVTFTWCLWYSQWWHMTKKGHVAPHFDCLDLRNEWHHWQCHLASGDTCANDITWPKIILHLILLCLGLRNAVAPSMMPSAPYDVGTGTNGIAWPRKLCCTSLQFSWPMKWNVVIDDAVGITWCWCQWLHITKKVMLHLLLIILTYEIQWCHIWCHQHEAMPVPMVSHDHVAPHFDFLNLRNAMVPLMIPPTSCGTNASASGIAWPKHSCCTYFNHLDLRNAMMPLTMPSASHAAYVNGNDSTWPKSHASLNFQHFDIRNGMVSLMMSSASCNTDTNANGITWSSCISIVLRRNKVTSFSIPFSMPMSSHLHSHASPYFDHHDII